MRVQVIKKMEQVKQSFTLRTFSKLPKKLRKALRGEDEGFQVNMGEKEDLLLVLLKGESFAKIEKKGKLSYEVEGKKENVSVVMKAVLSVLSNKVESVASISEAEGKREGIQVGDKEITEYIENLVKEEDVELLMILVEGKLPFFGSSPVLFWT